jgi:hypothetical protein
MPPPPALIEDETVNALTEYSFFLVSEILLYFVCSTPSLYVLLKIKATDEEQRLSLRSPDAAILMKQGHL